jgi:hypothetical protein
MIATQPQHTPLEAGDCRLCGVPHPRGQAASAADDGGEGHGPALSPGALARVPFPSSWADDLADAEHHLARAFGAVTGLRTHAEGFGNAATPEQALLLFHAAIEIAVRAGSLHAHLASKTCCTPCDPRVARFLSTAQSTALPPDPSVRSDAAPLSS